MYIVEGGEEISLKVYEEMASKKNSIFGTKGFAKMQ